MAVQKRPSFLMLMSIILLILPSSRSPVFDRTQVARGEKTGMECRRVGLTRTASFPSRTRSHAQPERGPGDTLVAPRFTSVGRIELPYAARKSAMRAARSRKAIPSPARPLPRQSTKTFSHRLPASRSARRPRYGRCSPLPM